MKYLYAAIAFIAFFMFPRCSHAADYSLRFGPGVEEQALTGATKAFGFRREEELTDGIYTGMEAGGYADNLPGRKSALVGKLQLGVKPGAAVGLYGFGFVGPCGVSTTDANLSTNFEFCTDIGLGVRDQRTFMNVGYSHISNAGLKLPNKGKDWIVFAVGFSL